MQSWPQGLRASLREQLPTLLILAALGGLAWWGYANDWKAPKLAALLGKKTEEKTEADEKPDERIFKPVELVNDPILLAGIKSRSFEPQVIERKVSAPARLAYDQNRYAHLSTRAPGVVWTVNKNQGDLVKKDEVMALIATEALGKAKADFLQSLIEVEIKKRTVQRLRSLGESVPESQRVDAELSLRQSRTRLLSDKQTLNNLGFSVSIQEFATLTEDEAAQKLRFLGLPEELKKDPEVPANLLPLKALFDGEVVERDIVVGEVAGATPPQFTVANLAKLWVWLSLQPADARLVHRGQEVEFIAEGDTKRLAQGRLVWISPEVDEKTRLVRARAEIENTHAHNQGKDASANKLRPNTFGTAQVILERSAPTFLIPSEAVQTDKGIPFVFVRVTPEPTEDEKVKFEPQVVQLGIRDGDQIEVLSGLSAGANVVYAGGLKLKTEMLKSRLGGEDE